MVPSIAVTGPERGARPPPSTVAQRRTTFKCHCGSLPAGVARPATDVYAPQPGSASRSRPASEGGCSVRGSHLRRWVLGGCPGLQERAGYSAKYFITEIERGPRWATEPVCRFSSGVAHCLRGPPWPSFYLRDKCFLAAEWQIPNAVALEQLLVGTEVKSNGWPTDHHAARSIGVHRCDSVVPILCAVSAMECQGRHWNHRCTPMHTDGPGASRRGRSAAGPGVVIRACGGARQGYSLPTRSPSSSTLRVSTPGSSARGQALSRSRGRGGGVCYCFVSAARAFKYSATGSSHNPGLDRTA